MRAAAALGVALAGCAAAGQAVIDVREVARSLYCGTPGHDARVTLLPDAGAVQAWQVGRGLALAGTDTLEAAPYAVVEMGLRPTGGYGVAVAPTAALRGATVVLQAAFSAPAPGSLRTQALSSPCVLVRLPPGTYAGLELRDASGKVHARTEASPAEAPAAGPTR